MSLGSSVNEFVSNITETTRNMFKIPELKRRILITVGLLVVYRIGFHVPVPGINASAVSDYLGSGPLKEIIGTFSLLSGGSLLNCTLFALGVMPYISAEIIFQLLTKVIPSLDELSKEGESGRKKIRQYARYTTVAICLIQGFFVVNLLRSQGEGSLLYSYAIDGGFWWVIMAVMTLTAGTFFLMWLGEMITEHGIGNGMSMIIMGGILAQMPQAFVMLFQLDYKEYYKVLIVIAAFLVIVLTIVTITLGQRQIKIQHAKHMRGRRMVGGQSHYMPLKVDQPGVIPIIFASALLIFPQMLFQWFRSMAGSDKTLNEGFWYATWDLLYNEFQRGGFIYIMIYVLMVFFFCFFWTKLMFNPIELAKNLRDYGSFIPGVRPGRRTIEYLDYVVNRITLVGASFLAFVAILPMLVTQIMGISYVVAGFLGGTGLLIVVGVALDLVQKVESHLVMRHYDGFFGHGGPSMKGRQS